MSDEARECDKSIINELNLEIRELKKQVEEKDSELLRLQKRIYNLEWYTDKDTPCGPWS